mmetsp:Transcript_16501/g.36133  ORF Transcript_16501/g.36133 Transcript_16501/m.36133 type:complete len:253 (+) Transcript_16501:296-1054(+)
MESAVIPIIKYIHKTRPIINKTTRATFFSFRHRTVRLARLGGCLLEELLDIGFHRLGRVGRLISLQHVAFSIHQELVKIPANIGCSVVVGGLRFQVLVYLSRIGSIDVGLFKKDELFAHFFVVLLDKVQNLFRSSGLLPSELVARKCENLESLTTVFVKEFGELGIAYFGVASFAGHIDHQQDVALELRHLNGGITRGHQALVLTSVQARGRDRRLATVHDAGESVLRRRHGSSEKARHRGCCFVCCDDEDL